MYQELQIAPAPTLDEMIDEAHEILDEALAQYDASHIFALFSGGNDSSVLGHVMRNRADALVHIDTGTALPGVRQFVEDWPERFGVALPVKVYEAGDAFRRMVLGTAEFWEHFEPWYERKCLKLWRKRRGLTLSRTNGLRWFIYAERLKPKKGVAPQSPLGFPGPAGHRFAYTRLKERQIDSLVRDHKTHRLDNIILLTGGRRAESQRRMGNFEGYIQKRGAKVWVAPIVNWTHAHMNEYRTRWGLKQSDVAALMHRSGECNCGAFAKRGERQEIAGWFAAWEAELQELEAEARRLGVPHDLWGPKAPDARIAAPGPMCVDCTAA